DICRPAGNGCAPARYPGSLPPSTPVLDHIPMSAQTPAEAELAQLLVESL
ncbi:MAG: hypothetical protein AVDCRST_MAG71-1374, partial [uncultured Lysobacter sp.]